MKDLKQLFLITLMLLSVNYLGAQSVDFGLNGMRVNYNTGIMSYNIPLFKLDMGGSSLGVSLGYSASGIKRDAQPGVLGYGWTLNCGGGVYRNMKGKCADEQGGHLFTPYDESMDSLVYKSQVNKKEWDGESDIFTAVFNNQSVDFIIEMQDGVIKAVPFRKNNFKIDCSYDGSNEEIMNWTITDDKGYWYYFSSKEITTIGSSNEKATRGSNSYVSSWKLDCILSPSYNTVVDFYYDYTMDVEHFSSEEERITYGKPMVKYDLNSSSSTGTKFEKITEKTTTIEFKSTVNKKLLTRVQLNSNELIELNYCDFNEGTTVVKLVESISRRDLQSNEKFKVQFTYFNYLLDKLSSLSTQGKEKGFYEFDYYDKYSDYANKGIWGYSSRVDIPGVVSAVGYLGRDFYMNGEYWVDPTATKNKVLSSISNQFGSKLIFDYENNVDDQNWTHGGIRIKSVIEKGDGRCDTTRYRYANGVRITEDLGLRSYASFSDFSDHGIKSSVSLPPYIVLNRGNNGLLYTYVEEIRQGQGKIAYQYHVMSERFGGSASRFLYPFWMQGALDSKAIYDEAGHIKQLEKYIYSFYPEDYLSYCGSLYNYECYDLHGFDNMSMTLSVDQSLLSVVPGSSLFSIRHSIPYSQVKRQMARNPNVIDTTGMGAFYKKQINSTLGINPYKDIFLTNYAPRADVLSVYNCNYDLLLGVEFNLIGKKVYYPKSSTNKKNLFDHSLDLKNDFSCVRSERYDFASRLHTYPTRIARATSDGDSLISKLYYPLDFIDLNNESVKRLISHNILNVPLKEQLWKKGRDNSYKFLSEKIRVFSSLDIGSYPFVYLDSEYSLSNSSPIVNSSKLHLFSTSKELFSENLSAYVKTGEYKYSESADHFVLEEVRSKGNTLVSLSCPVSKRLIFKCHGVSRESVCAFDFKSQNRVQYCHDNERNQRIQTISGEKKYRVIVKGNPVGSSGYNSYKINYTNGSSSPVKTFNMQSVGDFYTGVIDLGSASQVKSITYLYRTSAPQTVFICPANISFEANSYDSYGRLTHSLNQNMNILSYSYDEYDRLRYVKDEKGNILSRKDYKF